MLAAIRAFLETKLARLFFVVLIIPFVLFGIANVAQNWGGNDALANVGSTRIDPSAFQQAYRRNLAEVSRMTGGQTDPTPAMRQGIAAQTLQQLVTQAALANQVKAMGIVVPDSAIRQATFDVPAFRGLSGAFDRTRFLQVLGQNGYTENGYIDYVRAGLAQQQLLDAVQAGVATPTILLDEVFAFQRQQRTADIVELPFAAVPEPAAPTAEQLRAAYDDDPQRYAAPAYRRIKAVVLSPETIARGMEVSEADERAEYERDKAQLGAPETRTLDLVTADDEAVANRLAGEWRGGADWPAMQKAAADAHAGASEIAGVSREALPDADLAAPAFGAAEGAVVGPIKTGFGWQVLRVAQVTPSTQPSFEAARAQLHDKIALARAADLVDDRFTKLDDAVAADPSLDKIPDDLGAIPVLGTLDAQGETQDHEPAPIPGSPALRQVIVTAAFATPKGEPAHLIQGPDRGAFALVVEDETPPQVQPFEKVEEQVRDNFIFDAKRHAQDAVAAKLLAAVQAGGSLEDAALVAGVRSERTPPISRSSPTPGVPNEVIAPLFTLASKGATMLENADGFIVVQLADMTNPSPTSDPAAAQQARTALTKALGDDIQATYATAVRDRAQPTINQKMFESLVQ